MKNLKKLAGILLALVMVFALTANAFAAGTNSIKVTGAQEGETYDLYKMLDLSVNEAMSAYTYTVNSDWTVFFEGGAGAAYVVIDSQGYVSWNEAKSTAADMEAFGKAAAAFAADNGLSAVASETPAADGDFTFENLDSGYYLITSTNGTMAIVDTTPTNPDAEVMEKNPDATLDKEVQEDSDSTWGKNNSAQIGDTVNFKVVITAKKGAKNYVMHDKMEDGLTYTLGSVAIEGLTKGTEYTVNEAPTDGCTFDIIFDQDYLNTLTADTELTVTYTATLDEDADLAAGEKNDAKLTWGDASETEWSETVTTTYQFQVLKYDANDVTKANLADATFQLKDANGNVVKLIKVSDTEYRVANGDEAGAVDSFVTVASGNIVIKGVDLDSYTLVETAAPAGYNLLKDPVSVTVSADNALVVDVPNASGTELPSTGGIGTQIFYVLGSVLALAAIVLLISKKRMNAKD